MPFDGVTYLRCEECGSFVVEGEAEAHERGCTAAPTRDKPIGDNSAFLGCLTGTIKFGPGWDQPLPPEEWEALR